jgi:hypothetical protein
MSQTSKPNFRQLLSRIFRKINAPYRLTILNEELMSESLVLKLTKKSVYIFLSSFLFGLFILFSILILYTPLRYYVPGASDQVSRKELIRLQHITDSLLTLQQAQTQFLQRIQGVARGKITSQSDSASLRESEIQQAMQQNIGRIDHASRYQHLKNNLTDSVTRQKMKNALDSLKKKDSLK